MVLYHRLVFHFLSLCHDENNQYTCLNMSSEEAIITGKDLTKDYRLGKLAVPALRGINLKIQSGEFIALTGPSGSGKSTLLNLIGGLDRPTSGSLVVDGTDLGKQSDGKTASYRQKTVGMVFQSFNLLSHLSALQNVTMPGLLASRPKKEAISRAQDLLNRVGLSDKMKNLPAELSGGEQQRVAIVRALVNKPKIILADEPTGNLDRTNGKAIIELLMSVAREDATTLILVTHDESLAAKADRRLMLVDGQLQPDGAPLL